MLHRNSCVTLYLSLPDSPSALFPLEGRFCRSGGISDRGDISGAYFKPLNYIMIPDPSAVQRLELGHVTYYRFFFHFFILQMACPFADGDRRKPRKYGRPLLPRARLAATELARCRMRLQPQPGKTSVRGVRGRAWVLVIMFLAWKASYVFFGVGPGCVRG